MINLETNTSLKELTKEIERLFDYFNKKLYEGKLDKPVITIQSGVKNKSRNDGWFSSNIWQAEKKNIHEINLSAEIISTRTQKKIPEIACTLLHEMVHLSNFQNKIKDVSANGVHLKKTFGALAEKKGLQVEYINGFPKVITPDLSKDGIDLYNKFNFNESLLNKFRLVFPKGKKKSKLKKLECPKCALKAYVPSGITKKILCVECKAVMQEISLDEEMDI